MSQSETRTARVFEHSIEIPAEASLQIWQAWCALSRWPDWDTSLRGVNAAEDGLALGKGFTVVPKATAAPIPVNVTAFQEGRHFTTSSISPLGLLSFGHSICKTASAQVTHSVCAVATGEAPIPDTIWERLRSDVVESVTALARIATLQNDEVSA
ncbi:SRPBCC family protein [Swaminathania salitolerans]|uniref:Polyketide cyclase n=1 Tax=Swaminathania salitolerans TaxID=182838 RepID=A0A511BLR0_9PROT|nr:hypothetical protein [Swaminathania salitolerans]GBQ09280.1 hypothetical protein AA21291_0012 [Swaminathania salitolerans LMG 21291]GEL01032.1 hypothetical protein SSA02_01950 [Swaminathania salitolerans]